GERANQSVRRAGGQAAEHERREAVAQVGQGSPSVSGCNENAPGFGPRGGNERFEWSGRQDLNLRPPPPQGGALPGCATPRLTAGTRAPCGNAMIPEDGAESSYGASTRSRNIVEFGRA